MYYIKRNYVTVTLDEANYRGTIVAKYIPEEMVLELDDGGYRTQTTKKYMNYYMQMVKHLDAKVYQKKGEWYIQLRGVEHLYEPGEIEYGMITIRIK